MAPHLQSHGGRLLLFPIGSLILSEGIDRLVHEGRLEPIAYLQRHMRGDWGDITDEQWRANNTALKSDGRLNSFYVVTRELSIRIFTESDRSATHIVLPFEY